jgi:type II restriction enzyme
VIVSKDYLSLYLTADTAGGRGTGDDRKENIRRLLNFFPVLGEDSEGRMVELDAASVLSIPRRLKSQEVVRRGSRIIFLLG